MDITWGRVENLVVQIKVNNSFLGGFKLHLIIYTFVFRMLKIILIGFNVR